MEKKTSYGPWRYPYGCILMFGLICETLLGPPMFIVGIGAKTQQELFLQNQNNSNKIKINKKTA